MSAAKLHATMPPSSAGSTTGRFNERAANYGQHASIQRDMAAWLAAWLPAVQTTKDANNNASALPTQVLDLGAGDGTFTRHLAKHFTNVTALDCAEQMLAKGRSNLPHVKWLRGEAWTLQPLCTDDLRNIDFIGSSSLLQWCNNPQETLEHWAQRTTSGTRMLHGFYVEPTLCEWRTLFGTPPRPDWLEATQWQDAFASTGWRVLRSECETRRYRFSNALQLARSLHGTGAIANAGQLGSGRFRALLRAYDTAYAVSNLPATTAYYNFADTLPHSAARSRTESTVTAALTPATETSKVMSQAEGVFASWAFFRIEAERI